MTHTTRMTHMTHMVRSYWLCLFYEHSGNMNVCSKTRVNLEELTPRAGNWFARTITSDRAVFNNSSPFFSFSKLVGVTSSDRNYSEATNLSFLLPGLHLKLGKCCNLQKMLWKVLDVIPAQEVDTFAEFVIRRP